MVLLLLILALAFAAVFLLGRWFFAGEVDERALKALGVETGPKVVKSVLLKWSRPFYLRLAPLTQKIEAAEWRRKRQRDIMSGGLGEEITVEELLAYKFFMAGVFVFLLLVFKSNASWWVWILAAALGFYYPDRWVRDRAKARSQEITRALPHVTDMLSLSVEAGLDFIAAIGKVAANSKPNALIDELNVMMGEMRMGATRADGLRNLAFRCNVTSLSSFAAILIQADRLGVSIGQVLRSQADKLRTDRFQRAEQLGAQASQKILFPLVMCIMPAVFIVIIGPLVLKYVFGF
jgi:tight adherence protein C